MDAKNLRDKLVGSDDERAVSPVIGVILMVAVTVILAATIAMMVTDIGGSTTPAPTADLEVSNTDTSSNDIVIQHTNGDSMEMADLTIIAYAADGTTINRASMDNLDGVTLSSFATGDAVNAPYTGSSSSAAEIRVIHEPSDSLIMSHTYDSPIDFDNWVTP